VSICNITVELFNPLTAAIGRPFFGQKLPKIFLKTRPKSVSIEPLIDLLAYL